MSEEETATRSEPETSELRLVRVVLRTAWPYLIGFAVGCPLVFFTTVLAVRNYHSNQAQDAYQARRAAAAYAATMLDAPSNIVCVQDDHGTDVRTYDCDVAAAGGPVALVCRRDVCVLRTGAQERLP